MPRLLTIIPGAVYGGAHNQAMTLAPILARSGWSTVALLPAEPGDAASRLSEGGVRVEQIELPRLRKTDAIASTRTYLRDARPQVRRLIGAMRRHRADVVQLHGPLQFIPLAAARRAGCAAVVQLLDTRAPTAVRWLSAPILQLSADVVMSTGAAVARTYPRIGDLGDRVVLYVPPVNVERFASDDARRASARALLGLPAESFVIGALGNRNPQKGFEVLLRATSSLVGRDVSLKIVGSLSPGHAGYAEALDQLAAELGMDPTETFCTIPEGAAPADVMPAFDVLVISSVKRSEGIPTVIIEAQAAGVPVITTNVGSVAEIVIDGINGLVLKSHEPTDVRAAIAMLRADNELRKAMSRQGVQWATERWTAEISAAAHIEAYLMAMKRRRQEPL